MTVRFYTNDNAGLLKMFNDAIEQKEPKGKIETWIRSDDKKFYTHASTQWKFAAWFKPVYYKDQLNFAIIKLQNKNVSLVAYGYYHGYLIETFLNHFDKNFTSGCATALPTTDDVLS